MIPFVTGKPAKPEKVSQLEGPMIESLDQIEQHWLKNKPYLTGHSISIADVLGACEVEQPSRTELIMKNKIILKNNNLCCTGFADYDPRDGRPNLTAWLDRVSEETTPYYEEAHELLN